MDLSMLIQLHERLDALGSMVFEQFVTVVEAGDADSIAEAICEGKVNPNAARLILGVVENLRRDVRGADEELHDELVALSTEVKDALNNIAKEDPDARF